MADKEDVLKIQFELMRKGVELVNSRAKIIEEKSLLELSPANEARKNAVNIFAVKSLQLYAKTLSYLAEEILGTDDGKFIFLLPNVRTLMEIHARFLDLQINCHSDDERALRCIHYHLYKVASVPLPEPKRNESYLQVLTIYSPFLRATDVEFPANVDDFTFKKWVQKRGHSFTKMEEVLLPQNLKKYCLLTQTVFGSERLYDMYSYFSELAHGNPYVSPNAPHNERFWVTSMGITTTAFLVELVDRCFLGTPNKPDFREWLKENKESRGDLLDVWKSSKPA